MRTLLLAATVAAFGLSTAAFAEGEGNGEPFPGPDAAVTTPVGNGIVARAQAPYHYAVPTTARRIDGSASYVTANQDPYQFRNPGMVMTTGQANMVAQAPASAGSVNSTAQGLVAAQGTHG